MSAAIFQWVIIVLIIAAVWFLWEIHRKLHEMHLAIAQLGSIVKLIMLKQMGDEIEPDVLEANREKVLGQMSQIDEWQRKLK